MMMMMMMIMRSKTITGKGMTKNGNGLLVVISSAVAVRKIIQEVYLHQIIFAVQILF